MFDGRKFWQIFHQKALVSKTLANFCLFALFIVHIINLEGKAWQITKFAVFLCQILALYNVSALTLRDFNFEKFKKNIYQAQWY